jgi:hypothetical protein
MAGSLTEKGSFDRLFWVDDQFFSTIVVPVLQLGKTHLSIEFSINSTILL